MKAKLRANLGWSEEALQRLLADAITFKSPLDDIQLILRCGANVNGHVAKGLRPLHYAANVDYAQCVTFLLDNGANVNITDTVGYTPLHICARKGNFESMEVLVNHGATINFSEGGEVSDEAKALAYLTVEPLNMALESNHVRCVKLLLQNGATPNNRYFMGFEVNLVPLENVECLEVLLEHGADPNLFNRCGISPLMKACKEHKIDAVRMLIRYGADVNIQSPPRFDQKTALHFAAEYGNVIIAEILLKSGANNNKPESYKYSPLHSAVLAGKPDICEMLLKHGADIDERTDEHCTALMLACGTRMMRMRKEIIEILLKNGANVDAHSEFVSYTQPSLSPLVEYLKINGHDIDTDIVRMLLKYGATVNIRGDVTIYRLKDPFGVLNYLPGITPDETLDIILSAASSYDLEHIRRSELLTSADKQCLFQYAVNPKSLKNVVRYSIRKLLDVRIPEKVSLLPLPNLMKMYLLFEN